MATGIALANRVLDSRQLQQRWSDRRRLDRFALPASSNAATRGRFHDQRNMNGRVVNKESVLIFAMLAEGFAMIAEHDDQRRIIKTILLEPRDQTAEFMVGISDLAVVEMAAIFAAKRLGRIVRAVRVVKMEP